MFIISYQTFILSFYIIRLEYTRNFTRKFNRSSGVEDIHQNRISFLCPAPTQVMAVDSVQAKFLCDKRQ